jgi:hypothetical protein
MTVGSFSKKLYLAFGLVNSYSGCIFHKSTFRIIGCGVVCPSKWGILSQIDHDLIHNWVAMCRHSLFFVAT